MQQQSSQDENKLQTCREIRREKRRHRVAGAKKRQTRKGKPKGLQATATTETRSNSFLGAQGRKLHLKALLREVENAVRSWV